MKYELEKLLRQRMLFILVTLTLTAVYVYLAFNGSYDTFSGISLEYFWENEEYRQWEMSKEVELVDEAWIENVTQSYQNFVDNNRLSPEESREQYTSYKAQGFQLDYSIEDALLDPYNIEYSFVILSNEAYQSREMSDIYWSAFDTYIPLAKDPKGYIHYNYERANYFWERDAGISYMDYMGYSKAQQEDYWQFVDYAYDDLTLTVGYSLGWDVLCGIMQFLPFTLGMALIIILGNIFSQEQSEHMTFLLRTTKHGRSKLLHKKLILAMGISSFLWLVFQMTALLAVGMGYTLKGASCTAMCFSGDPSLYGLTWIQFYLIQCTFSYFGTLVFGLFICCMSSVLKLRLTLPVAMVLTLLTGIPLNHFCYADKAFQLIDKLRVLTPTQLMASYPTLQVYQSYEFGSLVLQLPYVMAVAIMIEGILIILYLEHREGGK